MDLQAKTKYLRIFVKFVLFPCNLLLFSRFLCFFKSLILTFIKRGEKGLSFQCMLLPWWYVSDSLTFQKILKRWICQLALCSVSRRASKFNVILCNIKLITILNIATIFYETWLISMMVKANDTYYKYGVERAAIKQQSVFFRWR